MYFFVWNEKIGACNLFFPLSVFDAMASSYSSFLPFCCWPRSFFPWLLIEIKWIGLGPSFWTLYIWSFLLNHTIDSIPDSTIPSLLELFLRLNSRQFVVLIIPFKILFFSLLSNISVFNEGPQLVDRSLDGVLTKKSIFGTWTPTTDFFSTFEKLW